MPDEGQSTAAVARSLNVGEKLLHTWRHIHKKQTQKQLGNGELVAENERVKAQLKRAEMERDILKKASPSSLNRSKGYPGRRCGTASFKTKVRPTRCNYFVKRWR